MLEEANHTTYTKVPRKTLRMVKDISANVARFPSKATLGIFSLSFFSLSSHIICIVLCPDYLVHQWAEQIKANCSSVVLHRFSTMLEVWDVSHYDITHAGMHFNTFHPPRTSSLSLLDLY